MSRIDYTCHEYDACMVPIYQCMRSNLEVLWVSLIGKGNLVCFAKWHTSQWDSVEQLISTSTCFSTDIGACPNLACHKVVEERVQLWIADLEQVEDLKRSEVQDAEHLIASTCNL